MIGIVLNRIFSILHSKFPKFNAAYAQRLVTDENVQYFFLAAYNFFSDPVEGNPPPSQLRKTSQTPTVESMKHQKLMISCFLW